jgi:hypothetical protein
MISAMQEVLSKTDDPKIPLREQEFFELSLLDKTNDLGWSYVVRQWHAQWSEIDQQIMWNNEQVEHFWILTEAERRYAERRRALAEKGFIYSDMVRDAAPADRGTAFVGMERGAAQGSAGLAGGAEPAD